MNSVYNVGNGWNILPTSAGTVRSKTRDSATSAGTVKSETGDLDSATSAGTVMDGEVKKLRIYMASTGTIKSKLGWTLQSLQAGHEDEQLHLQWE